MRAKVRQADVRDLIAELESTDCPREGFVMLSKRLRLISERGEAVPDELLRVRNRLLVDCHAESQGR